jgi:prepilin-type N-terminal cleavage/methylation domain-containing protein
MFSTNSPRSKKGFTLLELIAVVVVLSILAALAIPTFSTVKQSAADKVAYRSAENVVRNAEVLAAVDGAALNDTYLDTAGAETDGYNGTANTITISSGGMTAVATIDATTGAISISGVSNGPGNPYTYQAATGYASMSALSNWSGSNNTFSFADGSAGYQLSAALLAATGEITVTFGSATWRATVSSSAGRTVVTMVAGSKTGSGPMGMFWANQMTFDSAAKTLTYNG